MKRILYNFCYHANAEAVVFRSSKVAPSLPPSPTQFSSIKLIVWFFVRLYTYYRPKPVYNTMISNAKHTYCKHIIRRRQSRPSNILSKQTSATEVATSRQRQHRASSSIGTRKKITKSSTDHHLDGFEISSAASEKCSTAPIRATHTGPVARPESLVWE